MLYNARPRIPWSISLEKTVECFNQHDDDVVVHFSLTATADTFDLLVGGDMHRLRIRRAMLQPQPPVHAPPDPYWRTGLRAKDNVYCQEMVQIRTDMWSMGRVVLLGDAAHCSPPFSAMGTTGALVGACVLAGDFARHSEDLPRALRSYEETLRPFFQEIQKFNRSFLGFAFPGTRLGAAVLLLVAQVLCFLRIPDLLMMFVSEERGGWRLPEYPELMLDCDSSGAGDAER
ncbi:uncharacterized protein BO72DRAFT_495301 [Aspergillus fijiensis CBS 313.89]|uniref:FAD-binding domain-containing protein n=1 Tax=Aspergillus fijiensis CBS 313.89 TaxID=1448319 RepID=A0A8G1RSR3_9EURO|nr:uncharacterized protein BO72DRAFT_495301 [Aspergillus fijiensis CBS 313.89]RAK78148.1 hypothetical protein BO72DRAFT_495301 [Aspergillus fijiensis CBS 313.89]